MISVELVYVTNRSICLWTLFQQRSHLQKGQMFIAKHILKTSWVFDFPYLLNIKLNAKQSIKYDNF